MPLKSYRGFNTGNTLKRWSSTMYYYHGTQGKSPHGYLQVQVNRPKLEFDEHEFHTGVTYSLKKKQRWRLREYIRQRLEDEDSPLANDLVEVAEGQDDDRGTPRAQYLMRKAAGENATLQELQRKRGYLNRKSASKALANNDPETENEAPEREVTFDFINPSSNRSSFLRLSSRSQGAIKWGNCPSRLVDAITDHPSLNEALQISQEVYLQKLADMSEDELDLANNLLAESPPAHNLVDFVVPKMEKRPRRRCRRRCKSDSSDEDRPNRKGRKIIFEKDDHADETVSHSTSPVSEAPDTWMELDMGRSISLADPVEMTPIRKQFRTAQLTRRNLEATFGERYLESDSLPRKFAISIGDSLGKDITAYLVFEEVSVGDEYSIYDVLLNANVQPSVSVISLLSTGQDAIVDMEAFVSDSVTYVSEHYGENLVHRAIPTVVTYSKRPVPLDNDALSNRQVDVLRQNNNEWSKAVFNRQHSRQESAAAAATGDDWEILDDDSFELVDPVCGICFETVLVREAAISRDTNEVDSLSAGSALRNCDHHFCNNCWRKHFISGIRQGLTELRCPENECQEAADVVTVMRFVSLPVHAQHATLLETHQVENDPTSVWCPRASCNRAVRVERPPSAGHPLNVDCACGTIFCFSCREEAHWPAPCQVYQMYKAKLKLLGDLGLMLDDDRVVHVTGKHCPCCRRFIEKNGGCNSMICICGVNFCWWCGHLVANHKHNRPCLPSEQQSYDHEHHELSGKILPPNSYRSKHYCNTVKWRAMRLNHRQHKNYMRLDPLALREVLFKAKKRRGLIDMSSATFAHVRQEAQRVVRNYEDMLRIVEFCHVAAMGLIKSQLPTVRLLRSAAHKLTFLAANIRDNVTTQRPAGRCSEDRDLALQENFQNARETVNLLQNLAALHSPKLWRRNL